MPLMTWATHVLQWQWNRGKRLSDEKQIPKNCLSSDCRLQPAGMKSELLVIADQHAAVNTFPGLVHTARHTMRAGGCLLYTSMQVERSLESLLFKLSGERVSNA